MPIYEFHCEGCQKDSEVLVRSSRARRIQCPRCGSTKLKKKLSVFATTSPESSLPEMPPCSGNPSSCGRCAAG